MQRSHTPRSAGPIHPVWMRVNHWLNDLAVLVLVLWKSVQFGFLRDVLGGYEFARRIHFVAMALLVGFVAVHLVMVALVPKTLLTMLSSRAGTAEETKGTAA